MIASAFRSPQPPFFRRSLITAGILVCLAALSAQAQSHTAAIKAAAEKCLTATMQGDLDTVLELTHPRIIALLDDLAGGEGKGKDLMKDQLLSVLEQVRFDSATIGTPEPPQNVGDQILSIVPTVTYMTIDDMRMRSDSYMVAISDDEGKSWTLMNAPDPMQVGLLFPEWEGKFELPEKKQPEFLFDDEETDGAMEESVDE